MANIDNRTVEGFGDEWSRFDQSALTKDELQRNFELYFRIFPWSNIKEDATGFDLGCGSGRWAALVAPRVGKLHCIDASAAALRVAQANLAAATNAEFHHASVEAMPIADDSMDFGYSLGVLHHVPDTAAGLAACVRKLKPGAPFLLYLYYRFDNRPRWYALAWKASEIGRSLVSRLPHSARYAASQAIAAGIYLPVARSARRLEQLGINVANFPLAAYRNMSFYTMRLDALDRFGTRLEQRFTRAEIQDMMTRAGLDRITFSDSIPFWTAVGYRAR